MQIMENAWERRVRIAEHVAQALGASKPVVALESTVIAHGLPSPSNLEVAHACEAVIRQQQAAPATVGVVAGVPTIGLSREELKHFGEGKAPDGKRIEKIGLSNLAGVMLRRGWGATTVAGTMRIAFLAGLRVFSTGGIGGVHRGAAESFDVSSDLTALGTIPLVCVCAGAKAILDLPKTLERLETLGVPVVGYRTQEFPAFYSRGSGLPVEISVDNSDEAAEVAAHHWQSGGKTAVVVCVPAPEEFAIPVSEVERAAQEALQAAAGLGVRGKAVTPFLLSQMEKLTGGNALKVNRALLLNNAEVAARIAASLKRLL